MADVYSFQTTEVLHRANPHTTSLKVPIPLSRYWMLLKEAAEAAGQRTDKQELLLALLATTPTDGAALAERLVAYRRLRIRDLPGICDQGAQVVSLPGPRAGRKGASAIY
jgi:hypothetical protein